MFQNRNITMFQNKYFIWKILFVSTILPIVLQWRYTFGGIFENQGGVSEDNETRESHSAAAGTTFVKNNMRPLEYRIVKYKKDSGTKFFEVDHRYSLQYLNCTVMIIDHNEEAAVNATFKHLFTKVIKYQIQFSIYCTVKLPYNISP